MEGKVWNSQSQEEFQARLVKNRFYGYSKGQFYSTLSQATVQLIENLNHHISLTEAFNILREKNILKVLLFEEELHINHLKSWTYVSYKMAKLKSLP